MSLESFLANPPQEFRNNPETADFIDTLIRYLEQLKESVNAASDSVSAIESDEFFSDQEQDVSQNAILVDGVGLTILDGQVATVTNGGTAFMDPSPPRDYRVEIRNGDGSTIRISGSGKLINGQAFIDVSTQYTVRVIQYFIDTDSFGVT